MSLINFKYQIKDHQVGIDFWNSKQHLFEEFFKAFYNFINQSSEGKKDLESKNIKSVNEFYQFASWNADEMDNCYGMGFAFHKYYLEAKVSSKIEDQPITSFIGYCHHNNLFTDFLNFLITFFAWWRNDEGCTKFDPYNHADEFFTSSWAALVDTCKLFYLTSETVYHWQSYRVKYALDNIPGVILKHPKNVKDRMRVAGYEFLGFEKIDSSYVANFKRKDIYNYWEKEEKTIKKVYIENFKKVDPA